MYNNRMFCFRTWRNV